MVLIVKSAARAIVKPPPQPQTREEDLHGGTPASGVLPAPCGLREAAATAAASRPGAAVRP